MNDYLIVLALTAVPALSNFAGGLLAEAVPVSGRTLSLALHAAAGIVLAVVAVELLPEAFAVGPAWLMVLAFAAGGGFFVAVDCGTERLQERFGGGGKGGPWGIFFGVAVDLFSDGVMIGAGSTIAVALGLLLALGQAPADLPEGFATIATFKRQGVPRRTRLLLAASFFVAIFLGATVGYWAVRGQPEAVKLALLAFTAGILTTVAVEEIVPESHQGEEARSATFAFIGRFALFALLSAYLEPGRRRAAWYPWWVDTESGRLRWEAMVSSNHYMLNDFSDFDAPMLLLPPPVLDGDAGSAPPSTTP